MSPLYSIVERHADYTVIEVRAFVPQKLADCIARLVGWKHDVPVFRSRYAPRLFVVGR